MTGKHITKRKSGNQMQAGRELDVLVAKKIMGVLNEGARPYSTDITAAWEVVEKIPMTVYAPGASYASGEYANGDQWAAEADDTTVEADTAPLAICLAALKSVELSAGRSAKDDAGETA